MSLDAARRAVTAYHAACERILTLVHGQRHAVEIELIIYDATARDHPKQMIEVRAPTGLEACEKAREHVRKIGLIPGRVLSLKRL